jgi:protein-tyrosine-phosphatase
MSKQQKPDKAMRSADAQSSERPIQSVLFACTFNAVRSPMAANLLQSLSKRRIYVQSAGVVAGELDPFAVEVLAEFGIDMTGHVPHTFESLGDVSFDLIVCLSKEAHDLALDLARHNDIAVEYWQTDDPTLETGSRDQRIAAYRAVRDALRAQMLQRMTVFST